MATLEPLDPSQLPEPVDVSDNSRALSMVKEVIDQGPFEDTWSSLSEYRVPRWYRDAKFGIFLHWGVFSVPAFGSEWYSRHMYLEGSREFDHHRAEFGDQKHFGYKDFIPSFTMKDFDPDKWANLFRRAGAQFVMPVAEHHDGFAMYDTDRSRWSAARMGPGRDVFGELMAAVDRSWLIRGASSHRAEHWFFMNGGAKFDSDVLDQRYVDFYGPAQREEVAPNERYLEDWLLRTVEVIDKYRPQVLWFDWWIEQPAFEPYLRKLAAYYYNRAAEWGREVVINYKEKAFKPGSAVYDIERGAMGSINPEVWQNDTSVSRNSWCWIDGQDYKSAPGIVAELADVVSKNGVLLLNIGPKADGTIADEERDLLEKIGSYLTRNGEAIYGTRPWKISSEGPTDRPSGSFVDQSEPAYTSEDIRFTTRHDAAGEYVYAIVLAPVADGSVRIRALGTGSGLMTMSVQSVSVLGVSEEPKWSQAWDGLEVDLPSDQSDLFGPVVKVVLAPDGSSA